MIDEYAEARKALREGATPNLEGLARHRARRLRKFASARGLDVPPLAPAERLAKIPSYSDNVMQPGGTIDGVVIENVDGGTALCADGTVYPWLLRDGYTPPDAPSEVVIPIIHRTQAEAKQRAKIPNKEPIFVAPSELRRLLAKGSGRITWRYLLLDGSRFIFTIKDQKVTNSEGHSPNTESIT